MEHPIDVVALKRKGLGKQQKRILKWTSVELGIEKAADIRKRWPPTQANNYVKALRDLTDALGSANPAEAVGNLLNVRGLVDPTLLSRLQAPVASLFENIDPLVRENLQEQVRQLQDHGRSPEMDSAMRNFLSMSDGLSSHAEEVTLAHAPYVTDAYFKSEAKPKADSATTKGIPWSPTKMLGRTPSAGVQASISRALKDLEGRGLLYRYRLSAASNRTTHVYLSEWGAIIALKLRTEEQAS